MKHLLFKYSFNTNPRRTQTDESNKKAELVAIYRWCKCFCDPAVHVQDHYYLHMDTQDSTWVEPNEPYWLFDAATRNFDPSGLQEPSSTVFKQTPSNEVVPAKQTSSTEVDPDYQGYNPKIHGNYDPNAPYAQYHKKKREEEAKALQMAQGTYAPSNPAYVASGAFNRFTGNFQDPSKSAERHNDYNKSGRQMNAFFDVDAAANMHDGRSLKEERRNQTLTKQEVRELAKKRKEKKAKKRMDFYKS